MAREISPTLIALSEVLVAVLIGHWAGWIDGSATTIGLAQPSGRS
jgi:hypothetical protein